MHDDQLLARYIEEDPDSPGAADARLMNFGVPVWAIIGYLPAVGHQPHKVAAAYRLPEEAVRAALAYYQRHRCAIDARIAANASPVT